MLILKFKNTPIQFSYPKVTEKLITEIKSKQEVCEIIPSDGIYVDNAYYNINLPGTRPRIFTRMAIWHRLQEMGSILSPDYALLAFDAFRTKETQKHVFLTFKKRIKQAKVHLSGEELEREVRKYAAHPDESSRLAVLPHNSGGAIDLALCDRKTKQLLDFGCEFDNIEQVADTDFFEQSHIDVSDYSRQRWEVIKENRRLLFNMMIHFDFIGCQSGWWHYDLGDCLWAQENQTNYIFSSMEEDVNSYLKME